MKLPTSAEFLRESGIEVSSPQTSEKIEGVGASADKGSQSVVKTPPTDNNFKNISSEFRTLLSQYCGEQVYAEGVEQVKWGPLCKRLGTQEEFLREAAISMDANGSFWQEVLAYRIRKVSAAGVFRQNGWERLESLAVNKLVTMAEKNLIRDPGELLAVATAASRQNSSQGGGSTGGQNTTVNVNLGGDQMAQDGNGLPGAGAKLTIDLSPRVASALAKRAERIEGERVIDGQMLSAGDLRSLLQEKIERDSLSDESEG